MKQPVIIWTIVTKQFEAAYAKVEAKLIKYHPDIPRIVYREDWLNEQIHNDPRFTFDFVGLTLSTSYPIITAMLGKQYERVIHIDSDVFIFGPLDELFGDFDCACLQDMNIGVHVSTSEAFNEDWLQLTLTDKDKYLDGDQSCFNLVAHNGKHNFKPLGEKSYYSCVASYHASDIFMVNGVPCFHGVPLAMLHIAGRWGLPIKNLTVEKDDQHFPLLPDTYEYFRREFP